MEHQCEEWLMAKTESIIGFFTGEHPSCPKSPEPHAKAYRIGTSNFETIDSERVRVKSATSKS